MNQELSKRMIEAISHMKRNGNKLVRFPGGYWAREGWHSWNGPCYGTPTVEAIVRRGYAEYTVWKDGKSGRFPIECGLTPLAVDKACTCIKPGYFPRRVNDECLECGGSISLATKANR